MSAARPWHRFLSIWAATFGLLAGAIYAFILVLDPYQNVPFSPSFERAPVSTNQRFAYPALARDSAFDSAVIGTSTLRLLDPVQLDALTGGRWVNLAMNSATAYEQTRILEVFLRHHPDPRFIVIGIDDAWCRRGEAPERFTFRAFPQWMYDDDRYNDLLYLFNDKALENAVRMLELLTGRRQPKYRNDGYRDFTLDFGEWELGAVRQRLYPAGDSAGGHAAPELATPRSNHPGWRFPELTLLEQVLARRSDATGRSLLFPPFHIRYAADNAARLAECKARTLALARRFGVPAIDFMLDSPLARADREFWDPVHARTDVAERVARAVTAVASACDRDPGSSDVRVYCNRATAARDDRG